MLYAKNEIKFTCPHLNIPRMDRCDMCFFPLDTRKLLYDIFVIHVYNMWYTCIYADNRKLQALCDCKVFYAANLIYFNHKRS